MSDELKNFFTREINNYMSRFDDLGDLETTDIENGIKEVLGINITTDFQYEAVTKLNESTGKDERKVELKKIHILYAYDDTNTNSNIPKIGKITYIVN
jgi:hypothetical protein